MKAIRVATAVIRNGDRIFSASRLSEIDDRAHDRWLVDES